MPQSALKRFWKKITPAQRVLISTFADAAICRSVYVNAPKPFPQGNPTTIPDRIDSVEAVAQGDTKKLIASVERELKKFLRQRPNATVADVITHFAPQLKCKRPHPDILSEDF